MLTRSCDFCNQPYQATQRELNRGQGVYCSQSCSSKAYHSRKPKLEPNVSCAICHKEFRVKPKLLKLQKTFYCSPEHSSRRGEIIKTGPARGRWCEGCGKTMRAGAQQKTCLECKKNSCIDKWLSGDNSVTLYRGRTRGTRSFVKRYLMEERGDRCEQCGFDEKAPDGRSIIQMDHIDGNSTNNNLDNLRLLCPNHHAMTSTYGALNYGNSQRSHRSGHGDSRNPAS